MSLELLSKITKKLNKDTISKIVREIETIGYRNVYCIKQYSNYGFVKKNDNYNESNPPLFDLAINDFHVNLSVYGNLNDLEKIQKDITEIFHSNNIHVLLVEEGEEE